MTTVLGSSCMPRPSEERKGSNQLVSFVVHRRRPGLVPDGKLTPAWHPPRPAAASCWTRTSYAQPFAVTSPKETTMTTKPTYDPARIGLLLVDPYNDFLSEGGKLWPRVKEVAEQVGLIENL